MAHEVHLPLRWHPAQPSHQVGSGGQEGRELPHVYVHEVFSELFELLLTLDMMEGASLMVAEQLARWHQDKKGSHERDESRGASDACVLGLSRAAGGAAYCPALRVYVTEQLGKDTAILQVRRKAKEERELATKPAPAKK